MWKRLRHWLPRALFPAGLILGTLSTAIVLSTNTYQSPVLDVGHGFGIGAYVTLFLGMISLRFINEERSS